jgi:hypothetical protein
VLPLNHYGPEVLCQKTSELPFFHNVDGVPAGESRSILVQWFFLLGWRYDWLTPASRLPRRYSSTVLREMRALGPISKADFN